MSIEGFNKIWRSISIHKHKGRDVYTFSLKELNDFCGGEFSSRNIEIVALVEQRMRFTFSRLTTKLQLHFNVLFPTNAGVQMFFREIHFEQRKVNIPVSHIAIKSTRIKGC